MTFAHLAPWTLRDLANCDVDRGSRERRPAGTDYASASQWTPAVDILEEDDRFVVHADVPGVEPADINVSLDNDILSIAGQRSIAAGGDDAAKQRVERSSGQFLRRFRLPDAVDADGITARCSNGLLEVMIPKTPDIPARRITVKAA